MTFLKLHSQVEIWSVCTPIPRLQVKKEGRETRRKTGVSATSSLALLPDDPVLDILGILTVKLPLEFFDVKYYVSFI